MVSIPVKPTLWERVSHLFGRLGKFLMADTNYPGFGWNYYYDPSILTRELPSTGHRHTDAKTDEFRRGYALGAAVALRCYRQGYPHHTGHIHDEMNDYGEPDWAEGYCAGYSDMWETFK